MAKKKVFVSFDYENDKKYKYLLEAWDASKNFDFSFDDVTSGEINSNNIGRIKAALVVCINEATHTLVIIGKEANKKHKNSDLIGYRNWINFEIAKSKLNKNKLVAVKIDSGNESPDELSGSGATWVSSFNEKDITAALEK